MALIRVLIELIFISVLVVSYLIVMVGSLFVLRIAIDWFWDVDIVEWLKKGARNEQNR